MNRIHAWTTGAARLTGIVAIGAVGIVSGGCGPPAFGGFRTSDGFTIAADLHLPDRGEPGPLVVLGHQHQRNRHSWDPLIPRLTERGYAVVAVDHRGFGESTREASSPAALSEAQRDRLYLDLLGAVEAVRGRPGVDASRVVMMASGVSVAAAIRCLEESPDVRALVLFPGSIEGRGHDWLLERPEFPLLLISAEGERRGRKLFRHYATRFTGPSQEWFEIAASPADPADWKGTDGLPRDNGVVDLIVWFLERHVPVPASP